MHDNDTTDPSTTTPASASASPSVELPWPMFPPRAWRGMFALLKQLVSGTSESPEQFHFAAFACALGLLVGRDASLPFGPATITANLNVCIVGRTGRDRKSTALNDVVKLVVDPLKPRPSQPNEPEPFVVVEGSGSGEGFAEAFADARWKPVGWKQGDPYQVTTGRRALFAVHEFGGMLEKVKRDNAGNMVEFILRAFDAPSDWQHRTRAKSDAPPLKITNGLAAFACASTVSWLVKNLTPGQIHAGLVNRFLWFGGERTSPVPDARASRLRTCRPFRPRSGRHCSPCAAPRSPSRRTRTASTSPTT